MLIENLKNKYFTTKTLIIIYVAQKNDFTVESRNNKLLFHNLSDP